MEKLEKLVRRHRKNSKQTLADLRASEAEVWRLRELIRMEVYEHHMDYRGYCFGCNVYRNPMEECPVAVRLHGRV